MNHPENEDPSEDLGIQTVSRSNATAQMLDGHIESPALTQWTESIGHTGDVQEITIENSEMAGATAGKLDAQLPDQVLLVMVGEERTAHLPDENEVVNQGDHVTIIGERDAVREAIEDLAG